MSEKHAGKVYEDIKVEHDVESLIDLPQLQLEKIENPIDFASLTAQYPDVYAWITIPGTRIDYPIVQHPSDNGYYLNHTVDGRKRIEGAIYTENYNSKDFSDPNTLIYGHNMKNGSMFKGLHKYKDRKFMEEHDEVLIYQDGRVLKYKIFAPRRFRRRCRHRRARVRRLPSRARKDRPRAGDCRRFRRQGGTTAKRSKAGLRRLPIVSYSIAVRILPLFRGNYTKIPRPFTSSGRPCRA